MVQDDPMFWISSANLLGHFGRGDFLFDIIEPMKVLLQTIILFLLSLNLVSCTGLNDVMRDYNNQQIKKHAEQVYNDQMNQRPPELLDDGFPETPVNS